MNIGQTALKATGVSAVLFWLFMTKEIDFETLVTLIPLSIIPIFLCCLLMLVSTICPIFWIEADRLNTQQIFSTYFPYYSIVVFIACCYLIAHTNFNDFALGFSSSAFFSLMYSWVWITKTESNEIV